MSMRRGGGKANLSEAFLQSIASPGARTLQVHAKTDINKLKASQILHPGLSREKGISWKRS